MGREIKEKDMVIIGVSRKEATDIIGLLAAQLADVAMSGNASGACPTINITEHGVIKYRLILCLEGKDK